MNKQYMRSNDLFGRKRKSRSPKCNLRNHPFGLSWTLRKAFNIYWSSRLSTNIDGSKSCCMPTRCVKRIRIWDTVVKLALTLLFLVPCALAGCNTLCDSNYKDILLTTSATSIAEATFDTSTITVGYLDTPIPKPSTGSYFPRNKCDDTNTWADCGTYTVTISANCQGFLFWDNASTQST